MTPEDLFDAIAGAPLAPLYADPGGRQLAIDLEARRHTPGRTCTIPGGVTAASPALYIRAGQLFPIPRWLDTCWGHYGDIKELLLWTPDRQMLDRYAAWVVARAVARVAALDTARPAELPSRYSPLRKLGSPLMNRNAARRWYYATATVALGALALVAALVPHTWYHM